MKNCILSKVLLAILAAGAMLSFQVQAGTAYTWFFDFPAIVGTEVDDLVNDPSFSREGGGFPEPMGFSDNPQLFQSNSFNTDIFNEYGSITQGYIVPPMDGEYTIYIASDDDAELYIGDDESVFPLRDPNTFMVTETACCLTTEADLFGPTRIDERSGTITFERGQAYFFELFHKENAGGEFFRVGWERPDGVREIIPLWHIQPFGSDFDHSNESPALSILMPPAPVQVTEKRPAVFQVSATATQPATYQWMRNGSPIDGATLPFYRVDSTALSDDGDTFAVQVTDANGSSQTSAAATLNVVPDATPPTVEEVRISNLDPNNLTVVFSESLERASAENTSNYTVNNGATVQSAALQPDGVTVKLTANGIVDSQSGYEITIDGVRDLSSSPNPNEPATIELVLFPGGLVQDAQGFVVFEAEKFDENVGFWEIDTERGTPSNDASVVVPNGAGGNETTAQLLYEVNFSRTGRHIVWYRASGNDGTDDSAWFHIDGDRPATRTAENDAAMTGFSGQTDFVWLSNAFTGPDPLDFVLETAGQHTVGLARREDGSFFDKFIITVDEDYNPNTNNDGLDREETRGGGDVLPNPEIIINQPPMDTEGVVNRFANFSVDATALSDSQPASAVIINWAVNGEDVEAGGPTFTYGPLQTEDDGAQVQAIVRMPGLRVVTEPATLTVIPIGVRSLAPEDGEEDVRVDLDAITVELTDTSLLTVDPNDIAVTVNGASVSATTSKADGVTTISYEPSNFLPGNSMIPVSLDVGTMEGERAEINFSFLTESSPVIVPAQWAAPAESGNDPGFSVRSVQAAVDADLGNNIARAEAQLADPPTPPAEFEGTDAPLVINYDQAGANAGVFNANNGFPETNMQAVGLMGSHTEEVSMEIVAYLELPAGIVRMGANVDDGFRTTVGPELGSTALQVGAHDGGGGATTADPQYPYKFYIEQAGVYAFRMTWWQGNGGGNLEWSVKDSEGVSHLVNADGSPVMAYRSRNQDPPAGPAVAISSPAISEVFETGENILLTANAYSDAGVSLVEFFEGGDKLGEATSVPYGIVWNVDVPGDYLISARVTDANGDTATSGEVPMTVVEGEGGGGGDMPVLLVVSSGGANASDDAIAAMIEGMGVGVQIIGASASSALDAVGKDLVVISSTIASGDVAAKFRDVAIPVINWEQAIQDDMNQTQVDGAFHGTLDAQTSINIVDASHPLAAGLAEGVVEVADSPTPFSWGVPEGDAHVIATVADNPDQALIYVNESGSAMLDGFAAPGLRIHLFMGDDTYLAFNDAGLGIVRAAVEYALGGGGGPSGDNVVWVSFHPGDDEPSANAATAGFTRAPDVDYTELLAANGYNVTRYVTSASPDAAVLNAADLVIVSRSVPSGNYQDAGATAWNSITAPMIVMSGYTLRNSRMGFTTGGTIPDTEDTISLMVEEPSHPIFAGISLDGSNVMTEPFAGIVDFMGTTQRGISVNTDPLAGGGVSLASVDIVDDNGTVIGEWQAGALMGNGSTDILGGRRLVFLSGSREHDGLTSEGSGIYDLEAAGTQLFLNAVSYMLGGVPTEDGPELSIGFDGSDVTVSWDPDTGVLQSAPSVTGPWSDIAGAANPYMAPASGSAQFFRVAE